MTDEPAPPVRQLVKDGVWQVPPELRPANWRTMAVRECEETETKVHTRRKRTTEVVIQEQSELVQPPDPSEADVQEALVSVSEERSSPAFDEPPIISHLPDDGDYVKEVVDILYEQNDLSIDDNEGNWAVWEQRQNRLQELQNSISLADDPRFRPGPMSPAWLAAMGDGSHESFLGRLRGASRCVRNSR